MTPFSHNFIDPKTASSAADRAENLRNDPTYMEALALTASSTPAFCRAFLPESFYRPFDQPTSALMRCLDDPNVHKLAVTAFRGFGKSTIANKGFPLKRMLWGQSRFFMPICSNYGHAVLRAESVKTELETNKRILQNFGPQTTDLWARDMWRTKHGAFVLPRGAGQTIRGSLAFDVRPDLVVGDDAQGDDEVHSAEQRQKFAEWWFGPVCNAVDTAAPEWKIVYIANVVHPDALVVTLLDELKSPEWVRLRLPLCTPPPELKSLFPEFKSDHEVREMYEAHALKGMEHIFARDFLCEPGAPGRGSFPHEFIYWTPEMMASSRSRLERVLILDPARTSSPSSDYSAYVCWGFDAEASRLMLLDAEHGRWTRDELFDKFHGAVVRNGCVNLFCEAPNDSDFFLVTLNNYLSQRAMPPAMPLRPHGRPKVSRDGQPYSRVGEFANYYRMGVVWHHPDPAVSRDLEGQLIDYPHARKDDLSDAAAYVVDALNLGERLFEAVRVGMGPKDADFGDIDAWTPNDDHYGDQMKPLDGGWEIV